MINIEVSVTVNGEAVKASEELNNLVAWFVRQKLVFTKGNAEALPVSKGQQEPKEKKGKGLGKGSPGTKHAARAQWTEQETQELTESVKSQLSQGFSYSQISRELANKFNRSKLGVMARIMHLKKKGTL